MKVPFLELLPTYQELKPEMDAAYHRVMDSGWYLLGKETTAFEEKFAQFTGSRYAVSVANGLDALRLSLQALGIGAGAEVLVPANTFIATFLAVSQTGAVPVPVDCEEHYYNIDPEKVEAAITSRTRAIMPVHLYGQCADMSRIMEIAKRHNLLVVEDAAQAHGATCDGKSAGTFGNAAGFSFYPGKNLGAFSDAGMVVTDNTDVADRVRMLRNYGSTVKYHHEVIGINSRIDELQAAFLQVKLEHLSEWNKRRDKIAALYNRELAEIPGCQIPRVAPNRKHVWHIYPFHCNRRNELQKALDSVGVHALIHYPIPSHLSGAYRGLGYQKGDFPIAERFADEELSLPIGPHLTEEQVGFVVEQIKHFVH